MNLDFTVSSVNRCKRKASKTLYSDAQLGPEMWRVVLRCGNIPDRLLEVWFHEEAQARKIPKGVISVAQLFSLFEPFTTKFQVKSVGKNQIPLTINRYTDRPEMRDAWIVGMENAGPGGPTQSAAANYIDLIYPNQAEANKWGVNENYGGPDFLRLFGVFIVFYPASDYVAGTQTEGFFDGKGFHKPGHYPAGSYTAGFYTGFFIADLGVVITRSLGRRAILLKITATGFVVEIPSTGQVETISF